MYYFGITSLDRFKTRLCAYPNYCEFLKTIPNFNDFPPHLIEYVKYGIKGIEPPNKPQSQAVSCSLLSKMFSIFLDEAFSFESIQNYSPLFSLPNLLLLLVFK